MNKNLHIAYKKIFEWPWVTLSDSKMFNNKIHRAASLCQLSISLTIYRTPETSLAASASTHHVQCTASPSDMPPPIYSTPPCQSQRCQEELIYGRRTANVSTYHECHGRSDLEHSLLQAHKPGTDCLQPFDLLTASLGSSVNSKLYFSWRRTVSVDKQC